MVKREFHIKIRDTQVIIESEEWKWKSIEVLVSSLFKHYRDNRPPEELAKFVELLQVSYEMTSCFHTPDQCSASDHLKQVQQLELFPSITENDVELTIFLLEKFVYMKMFIQDFEEYQHEVDAAASVKWRYNEFKFLVDSIERAHGLLKDEESIMAIQYRYIEGHKFMSALGFTNMNKSTFARRLNAGILEIAERLKVMNVLDRKWT